MNITKEVEIQGRGFSDHHVFSLLPVSLVFYAHALSGDILFPGDLYPEYHHILYEKAGYRSLSQQFPLCDPASGGPERTGKTKDPELEPYREESRKYRECLRTFQKGSFLVLDQSSTGGGLEGLVMDYIRMLTHIDLIKFSAMMKAMQKYQKEIQGLMKIFGYLDSMISIASFRESLPYYSLPELREEKSAYLKVENLYHPLLSHPVANSIEAQKGILVTGSNASGKSHFFKEYCCEHHPVPDNLYSYGYCLSGSLF